MDGSPARLVREFHEVFDLARADRPAQPAARRVEERQRLIEEEVGELAEAVRGDRLDAIARELADVVYVAYGTAVTYGIDLDAVLAEVHRANMSKVGRDGRPVFRDGKVQKGDAFRPPDVAAVLARQGAPAVTAGDLDAALAAAIGALAPATDRDWSTRAASLDWDCWHTAEHIGDVLMSYAAQLAARPATRYVQFLASADRDADPAEVLEFAAAGGGMLAAAVRATPPEVRAYHPSGMADPEGFAAMGCVEALVHGHDIAQGLGVALDPPRDVCARVLARLFPDAPDALVELDPWKALLWATGRLELAGHPRLHDWRWHGAPLARPS